MQIFDATDPVGIEQQGLDAGARHPSKVVTRGDRVKLSAERGGNEKIALVTFQALQGQTGGAVQQPIVKRRPAQPSARRCQISDVVGTGISGDRLCPIDVMYGTERLGRVGYLDAHGRDGPANPQEEVECIRMKCVNLAPKNLIW